MTSRKTRTGKAKWGVDEDALFDAPTNDFDLDALGCAEGLGRATHVLERALTLAELKRRDEWLERAMAPFHLDFVFELAADQHVLLQTASTFLLKLQHPSSAERLLARLEVGVLSHDADRYALHLIGLMGAPALVPRVSEWFLARPMRAISRPGFPLYALMCDLLVRLQSDAVVEHIEALLSEGPLAMSKHHRYAYETALAAIGGAEHRWRPGPVKAPDGQ
ncbi:MAG: hypothetical protein JJ863_33930 [Deltaproteobacteria bacterium]|nr:hypothetical protein [Deltaproteobacteria bacterium]